MASSKGGGSSSSSSKGKRKLSSTPLFWEDVVIEGKYVDFSKKYDEIVRRKLPILAGRLVNFDAYGYHGFKAQSDTMGWTNFLSMDEEFYPNLIRYFYANLYSPNQATLLTLVQGKKITITRDLLSDILEIPGFGKRVYNQPVQVAFPQSDVTQLFVSNATTTHLTNELRFLPKMAHHVICANINTKAGNIDRVNEVSKSLILAFITGQKINLADFIFNRMRDFDKHLPYGMIITRILRLFDVDFTIEEKGKKQNPFNRKSLSDMGIPITIPDPSLPQPYKPYVPDPTLESISHDIHLLQEGQREIKKDIKKSHKFYRKILTLMGYSSSSSSSED